MNDGGYKLIIVEGAAREKDLFYSVENFFFKKDRLKFINLPAEQNIYMLWNILKEDEFQTDIVEILRDHVEGTDELLGDLTRSDIDEVFLFFDLDIHQNNLPKDIPVFDVIIEMLNEFNNETESGKLYISYPMIEAIRDLSLKNCFTYSSNCIIETENFVNYKNISGNENALGDFKKYTIETWRAIVKAFAMRLTCLYSLTEIFTYEDYKHNVFPLEIFEKQKEKFLPEKTFILSAVPEFILDYFREDFWKSWVKVKRLKKIKSCVN